MGWAKSASIMLGVLSVILLGAGIILLFVDRLHETIIIPPPAYPSTPGSEKTPPPALQLTKFSDNAETDYFVWDSFATGVSPVESVAPVSDPLPTNTPTSVPPGLIPSEDSFGYSHPLQAAVEDFGWIIMLNDATQVLSSMPNGYPGFAQYTGDTSSGSDGVKFTPLYTNYKPKAYPGPFSVPINYLLTGYGNDPSSSSGNLTVNFDASSVGCVGFRSIAVSPDGLRLYVAYRQSVMGQDLLNASNFPFRALVGKVAVFTRQATILAGGDSSDNSTQTAWTQDFELSFSNPFGSQMASLDLYGSQSNINAYTQAPSSGDDFGQYIVTSRDTDQNLLSVAVRSNFAYFQDGGAAVFVLVEDIKTNTYTLQGVLQLNAGDEDAGTFGQVIALQDQWLFAWHPLANVVSIWKRVNRVWSQFQTLQGQPLENFGTSICLDPLGRLALIGAPTRFTTTSGGTVTPGHGGSVYLYRWNSTTEKWELKDTLKDPTASPKAFGYWVNTSSDFQIVSVSTNQDNRFNQIPGSGQAVSPDAPFLTFVSIDQINQNFIKDNPQKMVISDTSEIISYDPAFGSAVSFAIFGYQNSRYMVAAGCPHNESWISGQLSYTFVK